MAIKSSGALSFATDIVGEFSDSTPHSLSEFYKGGGKVPDAAGNASVPTSGAISMGDFYGAVNRIAINLTISSNTNNYNIFSSAAGSYVAGISDVTLTINSAVTVGSTSTGTPALDTGTGWASGDTITIANNGTVKGRGGNGGAGGNATYVSGDGGSVVGTWTGGGNGGTGGTAFRAQFAATFTNNGSVYGGGGGGGGGGSFYTSFSKGFSNNAGGGGGGGAGVNGGSGGSGGTASGAGFDNSGSSGSSGSATSGGGGGAGGSTDINGGAGGGLGANGSAGLTAGGSYIWGSGPGGSGGTRGYYQVGSSFINSGGGITGTVAGRSG